MTAKREVSTSARWAVVALIAIAAAGAVAAALVVLLGGVDAVREHSRARRCRLRERSRRRWSRAC